VSGERVASSYGGAENVTKYDELEIQQYHQVGLEIVIDLK